MSSQIVMTSLHKRPKSYVPTAFTEHGISMLSTILKSKKARQTSIFIVRAFIALKNFALTYNEISTKLKELESKYNRSFKDVFEALDYLFQKEKQETIQKKRNKIGFKIINNTK